MRLKMVCSNVNNAKCWVCQSEECYLYAQPILVLKRNHFDHAMWDYSFNVVYVTSCCQLQQTSSVIINIVSDYFICSVNKKTKQYFKTSEEKVLLCSFVIAALGMWRCLDLRLIVIDLGIANKRCDFSLSSMVT